MDSPLTTLRHKAPRLTQEKFLAAHPGCWIQYYDDTPTKDPSKALSARSFDHAVARRKQEDGCAVCFSLQAFGESRTKESLLCYRNMGVDVDLVPAAERTGVSDEEIDRRKDQYLRRLRQFPLTPHWVTETRHGFHVLFRVQPQRQPDAIREGETLNRRLVRALDGDTNAVLLTQLLRVPDTYHLKDPARPFLCRLLVDNAPTIPPYSLVAIRQTLDTREAMSSENAARTTPTARGAELPPRWRAGLSGVAEGARNATAASLAGKMLRQLPKELWETAGWGGLKEWNGRNVVPLPERELRTIFESISRREDTRRHRRGTRHFSPPSA